MCVAHTLRCLAEAEEVEAERAEGAALAQRLQLAPLRRDLADLAKRAPQRGVHRHGLR